LIWPRRVGTGLLLLAAVAAVSGCAHYRVNDALAGAAIVDTYRFPEASPASGGNTDSLFVCLTFSGGGTRAAALAYGVMEELEATRITWRGAPKSLLAEVDCISSVSGGSFTAAYYGLFGDRLFKDFRQRFLDRNIQGELAGRLFNPVTLGRLASPYFSRSDLAAELYDRTIFDGQTFSALAGRRPYVILNATDLATGRRFEFTQEQFDVIGSDLSQYPVAHAVAASSAFPLLLTPISLRNHPAPKGWQPPSEYQSALNDFDNNRRRWAWARSRLDYHEQKAERPWVHLGDGGMADNIGLRPVEAAYRFLSGFIRPLIIREQVERFVIIAVNARTDPQEQIGRKEAPPGALAVAYKASTIAMDNYSFDTLQLMKDVEREGYRNRRYLADCQEKIDAAECRKPPTLPKIAPLRTCLIEVEFEALVDKDERRHFLNLPTTLKLEPKDVSDLIAVGKRLLRESPAFRRLLKALAGAPSPTGPQEDPNCA
jgi:NTE family protein